MQMYTIDTTDVQSSTITGSDHQLNVTCFFAEGTLAKGCVVCLEKSGEVVYQMIPRVNGTAKGVIRTEFSVDCYNISVVDWEEDGSMGSLYIPTIVSLEKQEGCVSFTGMLQGIFAQSTYCSRTPSCNIDTHS